MSDELGPDTVHNLEIWKKAIDLVKQIYDLSRTWPRDETYGLTAQVRRAAVSVPSNLAEGVGRGTPAEAARFAQIATGSLYELETLLVVAASLGIADEPATNELRTRVTGLIRGISGFIRYQRQPH